MAGYKTNRIIRDRAGQFRNVSGFYILKTTGGVQKIMQKADEISKEIFTFWAIIFASVAIGVIYLRFIMRLMIV
ncbi:hypothetical protein FACS1894187_19940 [Synergistales bacterium]|nr:hypothetical protein FACS1894187_19940 [Synergistales bacterium]